MPTFITYSARLLKIAKTEKGLLGSATTDTDLVFGKKQEHEAS